MRIAPLKNVLFLLSAVCLLAIARAEEQDPDFQVEVDPRVYPPKVFEGKGVKTGQMPARVKRHDALPEKSEREEIFARVPELSARVAKMDELDRDLLFVRARTKPLKDLVKIYPRLTEKILSQLQKALTAK